MMDVIKNSTELCNRLADIAESMGYECVECTVRRSGRSSTIGLSIDSLGGIKVSDCEQVSQAINDFISEREEAVEALFPDRYYIEVGSAGIERSIWTLDHFRRFAGRDAAMTLDDGSNVNGVIISVADAGTIRIDTGEIVNLPFERIKKAKLVYVDKKGEKKSNKPKK